VITESSTKIKSIGLLGGTSWPSTMYYYELLNRLVNERLGEHHSARITLNSIDYNEIKSRYESAWDEIPDILEEELNTLLDCRPDCIILCNMSLHEALDTLLERRKITIPLFHAANKAAGSSHELGIQKALLLGTKRTMEVNYFPSVFAKSGIEMVIPTEAERREIQNVQSRLAQGEKSEEFSEFFSELLTGYSHVDAVVLACTELPLVIKESTTDLKIVSPLHLQCEAAVNFVVSK